jgi:succinate dehydrogenase / fumarate reductase cytochrome b subunit
MSSLLLTVRESVRYRGRSGHYSWLAHRISGLAILFFLIIHVWDTANAYFLPQAYGWSIALFKIPFFGLGEIGIMAAVLYHAINGTRITLLDFKPEWWKYQRQSAIIVWILFALTFIPAAIIMFSGIWGHCSELSAAGNSCWTFPAYSDFAHLAQ